MKKTLTLLNLLIFAHYTDLLGQVLPQDSTTTLSEVMVYENRLQTPFAEQNRNINILTKEDIKRLPARSVGELLSYVAGVDVRQRGPWGSQVDISIDGGTFEQTMILINGIKVNDPQTAHHSMNIPVPLGAIERIEVIRGPAARIYGINSLTGAINIVTKTPTKDSFEASAAVSSGFKNDEGSNDLYNGRGLQLGLGLAGDRASHLFYGSHDSGNGYRYNTPFGNNKLFYQGRIRNTHEGLWDIMAGYTHNEFGANAYYAPPNDKEAKEIVQTALFSLGYKTHLSANWTITPRVSYRYNHDDYRYDQYDLSLYRNLHHSHVINSEINTSYQIGTGAIGLGIEARNEFLISTNMGDRERNNYGFYTEYKTMFGEKLSMNVGAYLNYNSYFGWQVFPGLDVGYKVADDWRVYINSGSGQRIPSFTDLYTTGGGNLGNPDLRSENAWYGETGIKFGHQQWQLNASYFYRHISNFIDWTRTSTAESWMANNFMENQLHGLQFSSNFISNENKDIHWQAGLSYNFLKPKITSTSTADQLSKYAVESLRHQLVASAMLYVKDFTLTAAQRYVERISYKDYFITDLKASYGWNNYRLFVDANNIFDVTYIELSAIPLPGRWFNLGFNYTL